MRFSSAVRNGVLVLVLSVGASRATLAQSPAEIVKKASALYDHARTYQATVVMDMSMGPLGRSSMVTQVKAVGNAKVHATTRAQSSGGSRAGIGSAGMNIEMVDDGKTMYTYMPGQNKYSKRAHVASNSNMMAALLPIMGNPASSKATYKMLPTTTVAGKPVYAIEVTGARSQPGSSLILYIDKSTLHFKQMTMKTAQATSQGQPSGMNMTMTIENEKFNAPIPDSVFKFTPPAGATETPGNGGMMGAGRPGLGGK